MDWLGEFLGVGAAAATGGVFGLIGTVATKLFGIWEAREKRAQLREDRAHEVVLLEMQMKARSEETEQEIAVAGVQGSWAGLAASAAAEARLAGGYRWVDAVRALVRPVLTVGLLIFLAIAALALPAGDIDRAYVIESLVFAAVTAIVWWFGDRAPKMGVRGS